MTTRSMIRLGTAIGAAALFASFARPAQATGPAGVWSKVSKVEYEPSAAAARVLIHGCFLFASEKPSTCQGGQGAYNYSCPESGYMYFECPKGDEALCIMQWKEIEASIAKKNCVGWGQHDLPKGTVRASGTKPTKPDLYELGMGVDTVGGTPCFVLDAQCGAKDAGAAGSAGSAGTAGTAGTAGNAGSAGTSAGGSAGTSVVAPGSGGSNPGSGGSASGSGGSNAGTGGTSAGTNGGDAPAGDEGGCAIRAPANQSGASALALLSLGAALAFARRRRH